MVSYLTLFFRAFKRPQRSPAIISASQASRNATPPKGHYSTQKPQTCQGHDVEGSREENAAEEQTGLDEGHIPQGHAGRACARDREEADGQQSDRVHQAVARRRLDPVQSAGHDTPLQPVCGKSAHPHRHEGVQGGGEDPESLHSILGTITD